MWGCPLNISTKHLISSLASCDVCIYHLFLIYGFDKSNVIWSTVVAGCQLFARDLLDIYSEDGLVSVESVGGDNLLFMNTLNYLHTHTGSSKHLSCSFKIGLTSTKKTNYILILIILNIHRFLRNYWYYYLYKFTKIVIKSNTQFNSFSPRQIIVTSLFN